MKKFLLKAFNSFRSIWVFLLLNSVTLVFMFLGMATDPDLIPLVGNDYSVITSEQFLFMVFGFCSCLICNLFYCVFSFFFRLICPGKLDQYRKKSADQEENVNE